MESVVERVDGVRVTFSAAVGVREPGASTDQLVVFYVPKSWDAAALARTGEQVRAVLVRESGITLDLLVPVTEAEFPKTANGKIQRAALVAEFKSGAFDDRLPGAAGEQPRDDTWLFARQWAELDRSAGGGDAAGVCVVLAEDDDVRRLGFDGTVVTVRRGEEFVEQTPYRFRVPTADRGELRRLLAAATTLHGCVSSVVFALPLSLDGEPADRLTAATAELTALIAALADGEFGHPQLLVVTQGALHVHPGDRVDLGTCALTGLVRTAVGEAAPLPVRQLDLPADTGAWARAVRAELADRDRTGIVAARGDRRWQPKLVPVREDAGASTSPPVTAGGLYLVTGGLGGIAHDIAAYLLAAFSVRLLLVGRSPAEGEKAARLAELRALGRVRRCRLRTGRRRRRGGAGGGRRRGGRTLGPPAGRCAAPRGRRPDRAVGRPGAAHDRERECRDLRAAVPRQGRRNPGRRPGPGDPAAGVAHSVRLGQRRVRRPLVQRLLRGQQLPDGLRRPLAPRACGARCTAWPGPCGPGSA